MVFIGMQFVRPDRTNPPVLAAASLKASAPPAIKALLDRSCRDCHSNETRWPWYSQVAPASWLLASDVHQGRERFNFSEWTSYPSDEQDKFLGAMCKLTERGRMPLPPYGLIHWDAKLSAEDVRTLCAWSDKMRDTLQ
ncbi:MAG TPA: heme-binding domain-containing protein [Vicinamibacterales bacterium]